jgi:hypothetical protein
MNIQSKLAILGLAGLALTSCGLLGNALGGGPAFAGGVNGTAPASSNYSLALIRFTTFGGTSSEQSQTAAFATTIKINGGTGGFSGFLVPSVDMGSDAQRFYKVAVFEDKTGDDRYDLDATNSSGQKDVLLADSMNGKADGGNRFLVFSREAGTWTTGKPLGAGWNLVTDVDRNTTTDANIGRADDVVSQNLSGITITY